MPARCRLERRNFILFSTLLKALAGCCKLRSIVWIKVCTTLQRLTSLTPNRS